MNIPSTIIICHNYSNFSYAHNSVALAHHLVEEGFKVVFVSHSPLSSQVVEQMHDNLHLYQWPELKPNSWSSFFWFLQLLFTYKPHAVLAHAGALNVVAFAAFIFRVPKRLGYYHSAYQASVLDNRYANWRQLWLRLRKKINYASLHQIVCVSEFAKLDIQQHFGIAPKKCIVIYNALQDRCSDFSSSPHKRQTIPFPSSTIIFFTASRLDPGKSLANMIEGFIHASKITSVSCQLAIAGTGLEESFLKSRYAYCDNIQWLSQVNYEDIDNYYEQATYVVFCSKADAFGMVNIEAMMHAKPILASAVGGVKEIVLDNVTGWLIHSHEALDWSRAFQKAIEIVTKHPVTYSNMCVNSRNQFLRHFQLSDQLQKLSNILTQSSN